MASLKLNTLPRPHHRRRLYRDCLHRHIVGNRNLILVVAFATDVGIAVIFEDFVIIVDIGIDIIEFFVFVGILVTFSTGFAGAAATGFARRGTGRTSGSKTVPYRSEQWGLCSDRKFAITGLAMSLCSREVEAIVCVLDNSVMESLFLKAMAGQVKISQIKNLPFLLQQCYE